MRVWRLVSDIELMPTLSNEVQSVEWLGGDGPGLGATFGGRERPAAIWRFMLTPTDNGTTLTYRVQLGPGTSGVTLLVGSEPDREQMIVAARLRQFDEAMTATVARIKTRAEASTADS